MTKQSEALYQKAERLYSKKGKERQAIIAYETYLKEVPDNATAWSKLGTLYTTCDDVAHALMCFQRAIEIIPNDPEFWMKKAMVLSDLNRSPNEAFAHLQHLKDEYKKHFVDIAALRGELVKCYEKVIALSRPDATFDLTRAMKGRARVLSEMGLHREAIEAYAALLQAEKSQHKKAKYQFSIALQYEALGEWDRALDTVDACLSDGEVILLSHKARILQKAGREAEAMETYNLFLEAADEKIIQTQDPAYFFQKASVLESLGKADEAIACLNTLLTSGKKLTASRKAQVQERIKELEEFG